MRTPSHFARTTLSLSPRRWRASKTTDALCYGLSALINTLPTQAPVNRSTHLHAAPNNPRTPFEIDTRLRRPSTAFDDAEPRPDDVSGGAARYRWRRVAGIHLERDVSAGAAHRRLGAYHDVRPHDAGCEIPKSARWRRGRTGDRMEGGGRLREGEVGCRLVNTCPSTLYASSVTRGRGLRARNGTRCVSRVVRCRSFLISMHACVWYASRSEWQSWKR